MFIDFRVNPAFYEGIQTNEQTFELRQRGFQIFKNSISPIEHTINQMNYVNLNKLVIMGDDRRSIYKIPLVSNDEIKQLVSTSNGKFIGFASVDPIDENAVEECERAFSELKLSGLKLNLSIAHIYPNDERVLKLFDVCRKYKKPIVFESGFAWEKESISRYTRPIEFEEVLNSYQDLKICLTQFGWPWIQETAMLMLKYRNLYTDTGLLYFDSAIEFYERLFKHDIPITWIDRSLRHQVMFASGNPRFEQIRMVNALSKIGLRDSTLQLIQGLNAQEFIGFYDEN